MMRIRLGAVWFFLLVTSDLSAQNLDNGAGVRKQATAVRVADGSVRVDGLLDEPVWSQAVRVAGFIQKEPNEGALPTEETEIRVVYDNDAIYIGARMHNREQAPIQAPMGRRDAVEDQAEYLLVSLDTFHDRLTAYGFGVTATGVRIDRYYPQDDENNFDEDFNPVWQAKTIIEGESWTAELWIPFSQLRFNEQAEQVWGLNLQRFTPTRNEMAYWAPVPRTEKGWASRFGDLRGIEGIRPTKRIEVLPYVAGASTLNGNRDPRNPFDDGRNLTSRTGVDLKMGVGPSLTLDATFNPDFGQVEADPSEVNLTANETFFFEKRPFFTEGARLLNMSQANNFFYSRRIGATPTASVAGDYVDYPKETTILAAGKLTGRLRSGTSLGFLGAVTDQEFARVSNRGSSQIERIRVAPRSTYGLMRFQQEFGRWGSTVGGMATAMSRNMKSGDPLAALLARNAFSFAGDSILRFQDGQYQLRSYGGFTFVRGEPDAIARIQQSSAHYFQRPDRSYWRFDPTRTSLTGSKWGLAFERTGGRHWLWNYDFQLETPGFEANDIGRLSSSDGLVFSSILRYRETVPGNFLRNYSIGVSQSNEWNRAGNRQEGTLRGEVNLTFLNFSTATFAAGPNFRTMNTSLTRGGPLMASPGGWTTSVTLRNRAAAQTVWSTGITATTNEDGGRTNNFNGSISFRPGSRWQLSVTPTYIRQIDSQQYVTTLGGGRAETYGQRYIFSFINRSTLSTQLRVGYTPKPDINIDVYAEPFAASGRYYDFGELPAARARQLRVYGSDGTTVSSQPDGSRIVTDGAAAFTLRNYDFNVRSFRSNVVLRWEWRPGSTLYLVWQQDRRVSEPFGDRIGVGDMLRSLSAPGSNYFVVKMSFWAPFK